MSKFRKMFTLAMLLIVLIPVINVKAEWYGTGVTASGGGGSGSRGGSSSSQRECESSGAVRMILVQINADGTFTEKANYIYYTNDIGAKKWKSFSQNHDIRVTSYNNDSRSYVSNFNCGMSLINGSGIWSRKKGDFSANFNANAAMKYFDPGENYSGQHFIQLLKDLKLPAILGEPASKSIPTILNERQNDIAGKYYIIMEPIYAEAFISNNRFWTLKAWYRAEKPNYIPKTWATNHYLEENAYIGSGGPFGKLTAVSSVHGIPWGTFGSTYNGNGLVIFSVVKKDNPVCKKDSRTGKYYDKNGKVVSQAEYEKSCKCNNSDVTTCCYDKPQDSALKEKPVLKNGLNSSGHYQIGYFKDPNGNFQPCCDPTTMCCYDKDHKYHREYTGKDPNNFDSNYKSCKKTTSCGAKVVSGTCEDKDKASVALVEEGFDGTKQNLKDCVAADKDDQDTKDTGFTLYSTSVCTVRCADAIELSLPGAKSTYAGQNWILNTGKTDITSQISNPFSNDLLNNNNIPKESKLQITIRRVCVSNKIDTNWQDKFWPKVGAFYTRLNNYNNAYDEWKKKNEQYKIDTARYAEELKNYNKEKKNAYNQAKTTNDANCQNYNNEVENYNRQSHKAGDVPPKPETYSCDTQFPQSVDQYPYPAYPTYSEKGYQPNPGNPPTKSQYQATDNNLIQLANEYNDTKKNEQDCGVGLSKKEYRYSISDDKLLKLTYDDTDYGNDFKYTEYKKLLPKEESSRSRTFLSESENINDYTPGQSGFVQKGNYTDVSQYLNDKKTYTGGGSLNNKETIKTCNELKKHFSSTTATGGNTFTCGSGGISFSYQTLKTKYMFREEVLKYTEYTLPQLYAQSITGKLKTPFDGNKDADHTIKMEENSVPTSIKSNAGKYNYKLTVKFNQFDDEEQAQRKNRYDKGRPTLKQQINKSTEGSFFKGKDNNGNEKKSNNEFTCTYKVVNDITSNCKPSDPTCDDNPDNPPKNPPSGGIPTYFYRNVNLALSGSQADSNINPLQRTLGYNWNIDNNNYYSTKSKTVLKNMSDSGGNVSNLGNVNRFEYILTPSTMSSVRKYNKARISSGGYNDTDLTCSGAGATTNIADYKSESDPNYDSARAKWNQVRDDYYCTSKFLECLVNNSTSCNGTPVSFSTDNASGIKISKGKSESGMFYSGRTALQKAQKALNASGGFDR